MSQIQRLTKAATRWACCLVLGIAGCASNSIDGIAASRIPQVLQAERKSDMIPIDLSRLRQTPPQNYLLDTNDVLGIYIEDMLGKSDEPPPVKLDQAGDVPPSIGYPVPVRENGTISLPLINPIPVKGRTVADVENMVRNAYTVEKALLKKGRDRIIVTLMKKRTYRVMVVRQESGGTVNQNITIGNQSASGNTTSPKYGTGTTVELDAYENDVLHALTATGGLPGLDAKNEIIIMRGAAKGGMFSDQMLAQLALQAKCDPCCKYKLPEPPNPNIVRIPIRFYPESLPQISEKDIILNTGDIVYIESRDTEFFYTGGLLPSGQHLIPRDYDLDLLGAVALSGGPLGGNGGRTNGFMGTGGAGGGMSNLISPSEIIILRQTPCGPVPIKANLKKALVSQNERILIQPGDVIFLRYTNNELLASIFLNNVGFNFVVGNLFRGGGG